MDIVEESSRVAQQVDAALQALLGHRVGFVIIWTDASGHNVRYAANVDRDTGRDLMKKTARHMHKHAETVRGRRPS